MSSATRRAFATVVKPSVARRRATPAVARELGREAVGHTLQPIDLVHEAYLRLVDQSVEPKWNHREHFYAAAAEAMRRILGESARRRQTRKRGGDRERLPLDADQFPASGQRPDLLALDEA